MVKGSKIWYSNPEMSTKIKTDKKFSLHVQIIYGLCFVIKSQWLCSLLPMERLIWPKEKTTKQFYQMERSIYKRTFRFIRMGEEMEPRLYQHYKLIAKKYHWPYIKESYDNT